MTRRTLHGRLIRFAALSMAIGARSMAQTPAAAGQAPMQRVQALIAEKKYDSATALLKPLLERQPNNGRAWVALGNARRGLGQIDAADSAYQKALTFPGAAGLAGQGLLSMYASLNRSNDAFKYLQTVRSSGVDLTAVAASKEIASLHDDPRFAMLFPDKISFAPPFVEDVKIIHEWRGEAVGDEFGWIARGIGDVDRDGISDLVISAPGNLPYGAGAGKVYVYSGKSGARLWKHDGTAGALLGIGIEAAGDVNGDGIPDVIAGAPGIGAVFVYSGSSGAQLYRIVGDSNEAGLGSAVAGVGDLDGDGRADFVAGAPSSNARGAGAGRVTLFSGATGKRLLSLDGENPGDAFGSTVAGANGRIVIGAPGAGAAHHGRVYVFDRLNTRATFVKDADSTGVALGSMFVSVVGDVNGDGKPDIYATDYPNTAKGPATGRVYVYSGADGSTLRTLTGDRIGAGFGIGAARTGDVDGDGLADLVIGAWQHSGAAWSGGKVSVLSGRDGHELQAITGRVPGETLGFDAVGIGDVNGDGVTDYLITSAWSMVNGVRSGRTFIVAGRKPASSREP